jgi:outer membrane beta-barrel protein
MGRGALGLLGVLAVFVASVARAADPATPASAATTEVPAGEVDLNKVPEMPVIDENGNLPSLKPKGKKFKADLKQELRVVQDRPFTFRNKFETGVFYGGAFTDPFLAANNYGLMLSYHFHDYIAVTALGWLYSTGPSQALTTLRSQSSANANTNPVKNFYGGELAFSPLFGKLTLLGKLIVYLDLHFTAGAGRISTNTGNYFAPLGGFGGSYILGRRFALRIDYHLMYYSEMLLQQNSTVSNYGQLFGPRDNFTDLVSLGLTFLF